MKLTGHAAGVLLIGMLVVNVDGNVVYTFNSNSPQIMKTVVGSFASLPAESFTITNNTGATWDAFEVTLDGRNGGIGLDYPFMRFVDLGAPGIYDGPGSASFADDSAPGNVHAR